MTALAMKLNALSPITEADKKLIAALCARTRNVPARKNIISEGDTPNDVRLILEGFAARVKYTKGGTRHIVAYLVPGDFCDLHVSLLREMDHSIVTLTDCVVVEIAPADIEGMLKSPTLARALLRAVLVDEAILRDWLVNIGTRQGEERLAHLFCELFVRLKTVGLTADHRFNLPMTQSDLGDTMGLTPVHVNRSLQALRAMGLITLKDKVLTIEAPERLVEISGFNPNYLHLGEGREADLIPD